MHEPQSTGVVLISPRIWGRTTVLRHGRTNRKIRHRVDANGKQNESRVRDHSDSVYRCYQRNTFKGRVL